MNTKAPSSRVSYPMAGLMAVLFVFALLLACWSVEAQAAPPANDNFANAQTIVGPLPAASPGSNVEATVESGEPTPGGFSFGLRYSVWYKFTPSTGGVYSFDTCGAGNIDDTQIGVWLGSAVNALTLDFANDDHGGTGDPFGCPVLSAFASALLQSGEIYWIQVSTNNFSTVPEGTFTLTVRDTAAPAPPVNTAPPVVNGSLTVGSSVTCSPGTWNHAPTSYEYQWTVGGSSAGTASIHSISIADVGKTISCAVRATNIDGPSTGFVSSAPVGPVVYVQPTNITPPSVVGTPVVGSTLTCDPGTWTNDPTGYDWWWWRGETLLSFAATHVVDEADIGESIQCWARGFTESGVGNQAYSAFVGPVTAAPIAVPVNLTSPSVTGTLQVGSTLTCDPGTWSGSPESYEYFWIDSDENYVGTQSTFLVPDVQLGKSIGCMALATNAGGSAVQWADSVLVGPVFNNKFVVKKVKVDSKKGTAKVDLVLPVAGKLGAKSSKLYKVQGGKQVNVPSATLTVKAKGKAAKTLKEKGKVKVKVSFTVKPAAGPVVTVTKSITLKKK